MAMNARANVVELHDNSGSLLTYAFALSADVAAARTRQRPVDSG